VTDRSLIEGMSNPIPDHPHVRALLVDDEPLALANLRIALESQPDIEVVGEAGDGREAVRLARALDPDVVFLDVQMPDMDGFAVLRELSDAALPEVIFVTAFDQHAIRAFEVHALDYLLKPFDDARFDECARRAVRHVRNQQRGDLRHALEGLLNEMSPTAAARVALGTGYAARILVRDRERIFFVAADDVDWFQAAGNYVRLHVGDEQHLIRATIAELQQRLDPQHFVRIHRSAIVNLSRLREVQPWIGGDYIAILRDGRKLKVSRTYRDDLLRPLS
jgi:two-component system LytT family response regulator